MEELDHYGVHELDSGVRFLAQGREILTAFEAELDIARVVPTYVKCPHNIRLTERSDAVLPDDPLAQMFLPIPTEDRETYYLSETVENRRLLIQLRRLYSGNNWSRWVNLNGRPPQLSSLTRSNLVPIIATGLQTRGVTSLSTLISMAPTLLNRVFIMAPRWLARSHSTYIEPTITADDVKDLPLEAIGAEHLYQHLRKTE